jgi:UDP-GlcNAc:undecaprenyl-phosphate/decaprenyl-phosphate GlcNAc-1-phosphate transferase
LVLPLFDTLRIFAYRILSRRSPFSPDRNHVHHLLLEKGCSHNMVTFLAVAFNIAIIALTFIGRNLGNTVLLLGLVSVGFSTISLLIYTNRAKRRKLFYSFRTDKNPEIETKVITLKTGTSGMEAEEIAK